MFSASSHAVVLRALLATTEVMTDRLVARAAEVNHQACANTLARMTALGIATRHIAGLAQLFHLSRGSPLVYDLLAPLFSCERPFMRKFLHVRTSRYR